MDHFCPWVVNTVGFYNRKFFILFLLYTCATICVFIGSSVYDLSTSKENTNIMGIFDLYIALLIDSCLLFFLFGFLVFHAYLVVRNRTTIEMDTNKYDVGTRANFEQVFGQNAYIWFLPVYGNGPNGDGLNWPLAGEESGESNPLNGLQQQNHVGSHMVELELGALSEVC
jgi:hypothetical protein